jgi:hypothetical protein
MVIRNVIRQMETPDASGPHDREHGVFRGGPQLASWSGLVAQWRAGFRRERRHRVPARDRGWPRRRWR